MTRSLPLVMALALFIGCYDSNYNKEAELEARAEQFFRGIYGCEPSVIDNLASEDITISYIIFETIFNSPTIKGRDAVKKFATGFCNRWKDSEIIIDDAITEENKVILIWSFKARSAEDTSVNGAEPDKWHSWGGISLFVFNEEGKISLELGEESTPGPYDRLKKGNQLVK